MRWWKNEESDQRGQVDSFGWAIASQKKFDEIVSNARDVTV
jgi:hypothetical protein